MLYFRWALDVAGKLERASPDELCHLAADLARTLVQVRCSHLAVEGEEDSAEDKRQGANYYIHQMLMSVNAL